MKHFDRITVIGDNHPNGTYMLRIHLNQAADLVFGRFKKGKLIHLKQGDYIYIGSALAIKGSTTLGNRLQRHCNRSSGKPHDILRTLHQVFDDTGIKYTPKPSPKKLNWNIDHLLDLDFAEISDIVFIRNPVALENTWSEYMEKLAQTEIFETGLGANDSKGHTHVQFSKLNDEEWKSVVNNLPIKII